MRERLKMEIRGAVQGVGFRPFVYRLATGLGLSGWVLNDIRGVFLEVEGDPERLSAFRKRLRVETPPRAQIQDLIESWLDPIGDEGFRIRTSEAKGTKTVLVLPDIATCQDCLAEILDPGDRRFRYPFANCTNCGPRFTIVRDLPYDRPNTTMRGFSLCPGCRAEYESPLDRRFHAQPTACSACGPQLAAW
ncbi:MAG: acylphosphatase, partial [Vicinamibacteria bacterium]